MSAIPLEEQPPDGYNEVKVTDIMPNDQIYALVRLLGRTPDSKRVEAIEQFLEAYSTKMEELGVLPEYLAWALYSKFVGAKTIP